VVVKLIFASKMSRKVSAMYAYFRP